MERVVIGISGRSGSGKTTLVKKLLNHFGEPMISLHTMDNYYLPRHEQIRDSKEYLNFDLPTSFHRSKFAADLQELKKGFRVELEEYVFNNERTPKKIRIQPRPIILVEGLFIYHYREVSDLIDLKVILDVPFDIAFKRRLQRDLKERNYDSAEIAHRYHHHAEPAYLRYIHPYHREAHLVLSNTESSDRVVKHLRGKINDLLTPSSRRT